jgi:hypothetical protein
VFFISVHLAYFQQKIIMLIYLNTWCQTHYFAAQRRNLITNFSVNEEGKQCRLLLHTKSTNISKVQWHIKKWNGHGYIFQELNHILMKTPLHCINLLHSQFEQIFKTYKTLFCLGPFVWHIITTDRKISAAS